MCRPSEPADLLSAALTGLLRRGRRCGRIVGGKLCAPRRRASTGPDCDPGRVRSSAVPGNVKRSGQKEGSVSPPLSHTHTHTGVTVTPPHTHTHPPDLSARRTDMYSPLCLTQVSPSSSCFLSAALRGAAPRLRLRAARLLLRLHAGAAAAHVGPKLPPKPDPDSGCAAKCSGPVRSAGPATREALSGSRQ